MRRHSPFWLLRLGWMHKPARDCGEHEFYNEDNVIDQCYHCSVSQRPHTA